jgi:2'-5' RNA ligase
VHVPDVDPILQRLRTIAPHGVHVQRPGSGHVTLFYAPARDQDGCEQLARAARDVAATTPPFTLELRGLGEFVTRDRVVSWLGVAGGADALASLRGALCGCDLDVLPHGFVPHLTLLYARPPAALNGFRERVSEAVAEARLTVPVDQLWVAGFPQKGDPADDLVHRLRLPLRATGVASPSAV